MVLVSVVTVVLKTVTTSDRQCFFELIRVASCPPFTMTAGRSKKRASLTPARPSSSCMTQKEMSSWPHSREDVVTRPKSRLRLTQTDLVAGSLFHHLYAGQDGWRHRIIHHKSSVGIAALFAVVFIGGVLSFLIKILLQYKNDSCSHFEMMTTTTTKTIVASSVFVYGTECYACNDSRHVGHTWWT